MVGVREKGQEEVWEGGKGGILLESSRDERSKRQAESKRKKKLRRIKKKSFQMLSHARDPSPDRKCKLRIEKYVHTVHTQGPTHTGASASEASKQQPAREREEKWRNEMNIKKTAAQKSKAEQQKASRNEWMWMIYSNCIDLTLSALRRRLCVVFASKQKTLLLLLSCVLRKNSQSSRFFWIWFRIWITHGAEEGGEVRGKINKPQQTSAVAETHLRAEPNMSAKARENKKKSWRTPEEGDKVH